MTEAGASRGHLLTTRHECCHGVFVSSRVCAQGRGTCTASAIDWSNPQAPGFSEATPSCSSLPVSPAPPLQPWLLCLSSQCRETLQAKEWQGLAVALGLEAGVLGFHLPGGLTGLEASICGLLAALTPWTSAA